MDVPHCLEVLLCWELMVMVSEIDCSLGQFEIKAVTTAKFGPYPIRKNFVDRRSLSDEQTVHPPCRRSPRGIKVQ